MKPEELIQFLRTKNIDLEDFDIYSIIPTIELKKVKNNIHETVEQATIMITRKRN